MSRRCMTEGLVGGFAFAVDVSLIAADSNKMLLVGYSYDIQCERQSFPSNQAINKTQQSQ